MLNLFSKNVNHCNDSDQGVAVGTLVLNLGRGACAKMFTV